MKLWYQSMSRQTEWGGYPRVLRGILDKVRDPDTEIHVAGITEIGGVGDQFRYLEYLETAEVLKNVHRAVREGFDAFLIGNIADPGLREAREMRAIHVQTLYRCASAARSDSRIPQALRSGHLSDGEGAVAMDATRASLNRRGRACPGHPSRHTCWHIWPGQGRP